VDERSSDLPALAASLHQPVRPSEVAVHPVLKPALRRVWRDDTTLQLGVDPSRALVLHGLDEASARFVESLDGTRDCAGVMAAARETGLDELAATRLLDLLAAGGALDDATMASRSLYSLRREDRERLAPDLASLSLVHATPDGGAAALTRRRRAVVTVYGAGRVGAAVASLLAAAGVGRVVVDDPQAAQVSDSSPAGFAPGDAGPSRAEAARAALARTSPSTATTPPAGEVAPSLVVLSTERPADPGVRASLMRAGVAHLLVGVRETIGLVGPLVLPGKSACLRCCDLARADRDPGWPQVAAQLAAGEGSLRRGRVAACDTVLATAAGALSALQALAYLDGQAEVPAIDGTLEIRLPSGAVRRRSWRPHPSCGCHWGEAAG